MGLLERFRLWREDARRTFLGAKLCKQARKLHLEDRFADALPLYLQALELVGTPNEDEAALYGVKWSVILSATTQVATCAAGLGNRALAVSFILQGMPVVAEWKKLAPASTRSRSYYEQWERWATRYLASDAAGTSP